MRSKLLWKYAALCLIGLTSPGRAQDYDVSPWGNLAGDMAMGNMAHRQMESMIGVDTWSRKPAARPSARRPNAARADGDGAGTGSAATANSYMFRSTPASRKTAVDALLARSNPASAQALGRELRTHDYGAVFTAKVTPFGLRADDAADVMTAYLVLGYLISNGAPDPTAAQVRAVRGQVAGRMAGNPLFADPVRRLQGAEDLRLMFVILSGGWESARKEGTLSAYSDGVARMFAGASGDMRSLTLTDTGFVSTR